jgi:hypothetical protein
MQVLNLLLKRRGVLKDAYKHSGESSHFYRLQELEYLLKQFKHEQDRGTCAAGLGEGGHGLAPTCSDPGIVDNG